MLEPNIEIGFNVFESSVIKGNVVINNNFSYGSSIFEYAQIKGNILIKKDTRAYKRILFKSSIIEGSIEIEEGAQINSRAFTFSIINNLVDNRINGEPFLDVYTTHTA